MSKETATWLNTNTLIGFGVNAWHRNDALMGAESNHYPGPVPIEDVRRRLFGWRAELQPIYVQTPLGMMPVDGRVASVRSDNGHVMGLFMDGYQAHQFSDVLLTNLEMILDDPALGIGSAGLLKRGAVAWVSIEVPENITTKDGVEFRPKLLATTSHDGSLATTYKRVVTNVVCDNTMAAGLREVGQQYKIKHSRYSTLKIAEARDALNVIHQAADDFQAEVDALCATTVTDRQWSQFLDALSPVPDDKGRARTIAENKREGLTRLWNVDHRVMPWRNTAWGVVQAVNTFTHHVQTVRNAERAERNMLKTVTGDFDALDQQTAKVLGKVLAAA